MKSDFRRVFLTAGALLAAVTIEGAPLFHAQGEIAGEPGADSVLLQTRLTAGDTFNEERGGTGAPGVARSLIGRDADGRASPERL